jgi:hypothetical protein
VPVSPLLLPPQPWKTKTCAKSATVPQNGAIRFVIVVIDSLASWCIEIRSFGLLGVRTFEGRLTAPLAGGTEPFVGHQATHDGITLCLENPCHLRSPRSLPGKVAPRA